MSGFRPRLQSLAIIAALAILVRLLVPTGFMPHVAQGQIAIVACPGAMVEASHGHGHDAPAHDGFERPCAFAAVAAAATILAMVVLLASPLRPNALRFVPIPTVARPRAATRWRPPLRAPPVILLEN